MDNLQNKWGGLVVKKFNSIFGVQRSNFTNDIVAINNGILIKYSIIKLPRLGGDMCKKLIRWKIIEIKIFFIIYIIILSIIIIVDNKKQLQHD